MAKQLLDARQCGVYKLIRKPEEVESAANEAGLAVFRIDIGHAHGKKDFLANIAKALRFPNWFGGNWDALNDCLSDLGWLSAHTGYVLVFENSEHFADRNRQEFDIATAVLDDAAEYWKSEGRAFWAFVAGPKAWDCGLPEWPDDSPGATIK